MTLNEKIVAALKDASVAIGTYFVCQLCGEHPEAASDEWWLSGPYPSEEEEPRYVQVLCASCLDPAHKAHQDDKRFWNAKGCEIYAQFWEGEGRQV